MPPPPPSLSPVAQSESKAKFLERLGLDETNKSHRQVYADMKAEAVVGWKRIMASREALMPPLRDNPAIRPPYTYAQIDEAAMEAEIRGIYERAQFQTRCMYDQSREGRIEENWVIRWLLWHVFRYRDDRNNSNRERKRDQGQRLLSDSDEGGRPGLTEIHKPTPGMNQLRRYSNLPEQPVEHNHFQQYLPHQHHFHVNGEFAAAFLPKPRDGLLPTPPAGTSPSRFWDPVRDDYKHS